MAMMGFFGDNQTILALVGYYVGSAAISSLPVPVTDSGELYKWFYKFANTLAANASAIRGKQAFEERKPSDPQPPA